MRSQGTGGIYSASYRFIQVQAIAGPTKKHGRRPPCHTCRTVHGWRNACDGVILVCNLARPPPAILPKDPAVKPIGSLGLAAVLFVQFAALRAAEPGSSSNQPAIREEKDVVYLAAERL